MPPLGSGTTTWTLSYWYYENSAGGSTQMLQGHSGGNWGARFHLFQHGSLLNMHNQSGISHDVSMAFQPTPSHWHHFAAGVSGPKTVNAWIDGNPTVHTRTDSQSHYGVTYGQLFLNGFEHPVGTPWANNYRTGHFDNVRYYNRILTDAEVSSIYNTEKVP